jgi:predicted secreted protein
MTRLRQVACRWLACFGVLACMGAGSAQAQALEPMPVNANVVQIAASGLLEVPQDWLTLHMSVTREGADAAQVQSQLRAALDGALGIAKGAATAQQLVVRSGNFGVYARYDKGGKVSGWQGQAELVLEGRDFTRIAHTASQMQSLAVSNMVFSLSREAQQQLESDVQALAIERFQRRAGEVAKAFGFAAYQLREVSISSADAGGGGVFRRQSMVMDAGSSMRELEPLPAEPGRSQLTVSVSGSVQLK